MAPLIGTSWHGVVDVCRLDLILDVPLANRTTIVVCLLEQPGNKSDHSWRWKFFWVLLFVWLWRWQWLFLLPRPIPVECRGETSVEEAVVLVRALFGANMIVRQNYQKYPRCLIFNFKYSRCLILNFEYPGCLIVTVSAPCLPRRSSLCWRCPRSGCCRPFKFYLIFVFFIVLIIVVDRELLAIGNGGRRELVTLHLLLLNRRSIKQQQ